MDDNRTDSQTHGYPIRRRDPRIEEAANILQWIIVALALALIVRAFVAESFRIPTDRKSVV